MDYSLDSVDSTSVASSSKPLDFYLRFYSGHKGMYGHEFIEFELRTDGKLRYANNSNYKKDTMIRKELYISQTVILEIIKIISDSGIMLQDDINWPQPDKSGLQELEILIPGNSHISFLTCKLSSLAQVQESKDPDGLCRFYYLVQDLKTFIFDLISLHFKVHEYFMFEIYFGTI